MRKTYYFSVPDALSSCEQEITRLTCIGWSNKQITERLNLKVTADVLLLPARMPCEHIPFIPPLDGFTDYKRGRLAHAERGPPIRPA
jgi:hypothetical protein